MQRSAKRHDSKKRITDRVVAVVLGLLLALPAQAQARCQADSPGHRVALLELYTSEGCNSCPPADRFLRSLAAAGLDSGSIVTLAFHVDYWDSLGWRDRFAQPAFSARQRTAAARGGARLVYTPQFFLDGRDLGGGWLTEELRTRLGAINRQPASANLRISQQLRDDTLELVVTPALGTGVAADLFVAVVESGLSSAVTAGENSGRLLQHDRVARVLEGPLPAAARSLSVRLAPQWNRARLEVVAFLQARPGAAVAQALAVPLCSE